MLASFYWNIKLHRVRVCRCLPDSQALRRSSICKSIHGLSRLQSVDQISCPKLGSTWSTLGRRLRHNRVCGTSYIRATSSSLAAEYCTCPGGYIGEECTVLTAFTYRCFGVGLSGSPISALHLPGLLLSRAGPTLCFRPGSHCFGTVPKLACPENPLDWGYLFLVPPVHPSVHSQSLCKCNIIFVLCLGFSTRTSWWQRL